MQSLHIGRGLEDYTGVRIHAGQNGNGKEMYYFAGDETGYVLEVENPMGSQQMAYNILSMLKLRGVRYQPYEADSAMLDPAAEIGDGVTADGTSSVILSQQTRHGRLMAADISAPYEEEVDHEFKYEPKLQREFKRESSYSRARLTINENAIVAEVTRATGAEGALSARLTIAEGAITAEVTRATNAEGALSSRLTIAEGEISAKVSKTGGAASSFGWTLTDSDWSLYSNSTRVLHATQSGIEVTGTITATAGTIGGCSIVNGVLTIGSANITSLNANVITAGTLNVDRIADLSIGGAKITNSTLTGGKVAMNTLTGGANGNMALSTITTNNTVSGINTNLGHAAGYGLATTQGTSSYPSYFRTGTLVCTYMTLYGQSVTIRDITIGSTTYHVLSTISNPY